MKFLIWFLLGAIIVYWVLRSKNRSADPQSSRSARGNASPDETETMIECAHCGTYVPASECVVAPSGSAFCSEEHRRLHS